MGKGGLSLAVARRCVYGGFLVSTNMRGSPTTTQRTVDKFSTSYDREFRSFPLGAFALNKELASCNMAQGRGNSSGGPPKIFYGNTAYADFYHGVGKWHEKRPEIRDGRAGDSIGRMLLGGGKCGGTSIAKEQYPGHAANQTQPAAKARSNLGLTEGRQIDFWQSNYKAEFIRASARQAQSTGGGIGRTHSAPDLHPGSHANRR